MNSQICITLQKLHLPSQFNNLKNISLYILSDSGFQHFIINRTIKNQTLNFFSQKLFLHSNATQLLFQITNQSLSAQNKRICSFSYLIKNLTFQSQKQIIKDCIENYNDFYFLFSIKLVLEHDSQTIQITDSQFSQFNLKQLNLNQKRNIQIIEPNDQFKKFSKVYSPRNVSSKLLDVMNQQNWQIKSEYSPSKNRICTMNEKQQDTSEFDKKSTNQSITVQSQSIQKNILKIEPQSTQTHKFQLLKLKPGDMNAEKQYTENQNKLMRKINGFIDYKNFALLGGILGVFSAVISTELLIL